MLVCWAILKYNGHIKAKQYSLEIYEIEKDAVDLKKSLVDKIRAFEVYGALDFTMAAVPLVLPELFEEKKLLMDTVSSLSLVKKQMR